jgi:hypothetical protein
MTIDKGEDTVLMYKHGEVTIRAGKVVAVQIKAPAKSKPKPASGSDQTRPTDSGKACQETGSQTGTAAGQIEASTRR